MKEYDFDAEIKTSKREVYVTFPKDIKKRVKRGMFVHIKCTVKEDEAKRQ